MSDDFTAVEIPRDQWGRPMILPPKGKKRVPYRRTTTFVGCLDDMNNLMKWQARQVAYGMGQRDDLVLAAAAVHTHLVRKGLRSYASINVRSAEVLDTHAFAVLIGVGATTVNAGHLTVLSSADAACEVGTTTAQVNWQLKYNTTATAVLNYSITMSGYYEMA